MQITQNKNGFFNYIFLHITFLIYSLSSLLSKYASGKPFLSSAFIVCFLLVFIVLALYALLWQKALKLFPLVTAYANKGAVVVWNLLWAALLLGENITIENIAGSAIIIIGIVLVSSDE